MVLCELYARSPVLEQVYQPVIQGEEGSPASFHGVNIPTMANWLTNMTSMNEKLGRDEHYHTIT